MLNVPPVKVMLPLVVSAPPNCVDPSSNINACVKDLPAGVIVFVEEFLKYIFALPLTVTPLPSVMFPYANGEKVLITKATAEVRVEKSMDGNAQFKTICNEVILPALSITAVSCGSGKLFTLGDPPEEVAHPVADQTCEPAKFQ